MAEAIKHAYAPLYVRREYMHKLSDEELKGLLIEETGEAEDSNVIKMLLNCIQALKQLADFDTIGVSHSVASPLNKISNDANTNEIDKSKILVTKSVGKEFNLSYTINLNLPATSDISVFNAIFKSLKENLLKDE